MGELGILGGQDEYLTALVDYLRGDSDNESADGSRNSWVACASEGGTCLVTGTQTVRYGSGNSWNTRVVTGSISCSNGAFGDPAPGVPKVCQYAESQSQAGVQTNWVHCSNESQTCNVTGTRAVRFGVDERWNTRTVTNGVSCNTGEFGDPASGENKTCQYAETTNYGFRPRVSKLGDFVHSNPVYVGPPVSRYEDEEYKTFKTSFSGRTPVVYVGGNDGMLHGFDARNGEELLAFVPYAVADKLYELADPEYSHAYFVDGVQTSGDVCVGLGATCSWKTILVGSLRSGGQGVYALDVTNPANFKESDAGSIFLWEFNRIHDSDMGFSFGKPLITELPDGKWGVIVANGYNSQNGKAVLYVLDALTGNQLAKIDTQSGTASSPNGLSSPTAVDTDLDGKVDFVYAGDLKGNMWKFDLRSTSQSNWKVSYSNGSNPLPLFSGGSNRPITVAPTVGRHPSEVGYIVYFGTGKYIELTDNQSVGQSLQGFFGIWDDNRNDSDFSSSITNSDLLTQNILHELVLYPNDTNGDGSNDSGDEAQTFRITSRNGICWSNCGGATPHRGWVFELALNGANRGEKQVTKPQLRNNRVIFTTLLPAASACSSGGQSWLMELSSIDGSSLLEPPFDLNRDAEFNKEDVNYANWTTEDITSICPAGQCPSPAGLLGEGIMQTPTIIDCARGVECKYISGSGGSIDQIDENSGANSLGRQSWRELRGD